MKSHELFSNELKNMVSAPAQELYNYLEENIECFFATPYISDYYRILKDVDISASGKALPKLIKAWLAFLCGDNAVLHAFLIHFDELELKGAQESSMYYALKAIMGISPDPLDRLKYAKLSVDVLSIGDKSIFMANAKLTYAQILAGFDQYRNAVQIFEEAYHLFYRIDMHFPAAVALVNKLLNRYKLGELGEVIDECNKTLYMSASFRSELQEYWNIVHLPLGICYYVMNKPSLAIEHLKLSKSCVDKMNLFHMHGLIELYLFKSYCILKDKAGMEDMKIQAEADFKHMHYMYTDLLISMFSVQTYEPGGEQKLQSVIEKLELEYTKSSGKSNFILVETLALLKIKGISDAVSIQDIEKYIEKLKYTGVIPDIQMFLILLAEMYFIENKLKNASDSMKEAVSIYHEYQISASFYQIPLKSAVLLKKLDQQLYDKVARNSNISRLIPETMILSAREKEIMQQVAMGKSNEEISNALFISVGTIKWHLNQIFGKLEVANRIQATQKARELGII